MLPMSVSAARCGGWASPAREELGRPALKPLPAEPYVYAEWRIRRAGLDNHVEVEEHYYSVRARAVSADESGTKRRKISSA